MSQIGERTLTGTDSGKTPCETIAVLDRSWLRRYAMLQSGPRPIRSSISCLKLEKETNWTRSFIKIGTLTRILQKSLCKTYGKVNAENPGRGKTVGRPILLVAFGNLFLTFKITFGCKQNILLQIMSSSEFVSQARPRT